VGWILSLPLDFDRSFLFYFSMKGPDRCDMRLRRQYESPRGEIE
jgi:hypothetical protein